MSRENTAKALISATQTFGFVNESSSQDEGGCFVKETRKGNLFCIEASDYGATGIKLTLVDLYTAKNIISAVVSNETQVTDFVISCYRKAK